VGLFYAAHREEHALRASSMGNVNGMGREADPSGTLRDDKKLRSRVLRARRIALRARSSRSKTIPYINRRRHKKDSYKERPMLAARRLPEGPANESEKYEDNCIASAIWSLRGDPRGDITGQ
jgi:hypothetical protein